MRKISRLLTLDSKDLIKGNLKIYQQQLWKQFKDNYNGTLVIVRSNYGKDFAFFVPEQFKKI